MPDIKITELPVASTLTDSDELIVQQSDGTKRATLANLPAGVPDGGTTDQVLTKRSSDDGDADWQNAGVWHGDDVGDSPVPLNADQLQGHPSSYFQSALTTATATATMSANSDHVAISAPTVSGYEFMLWVNARTIGWVDGVYIENPTGANTAVWRNNGASSPAIASGGTVSALAIYKKS